MRAARADPAGGAVPRWVYVAAAFGLAAAVTIVVLGASEQHGRRIGQVSSVSLTKVGGPAGPAKAGPVTVRGAEASRLAARLNALPQFPSGEMSCPAATAGAYRLRFATDSGPAVEVHVEATGCAEVDARSAGQAWGWGKWDRYGSVRAEIARDLRAG